MKIFMEPERAKGKEKKVMFSTSIPKRLRDDLEEAVSRLHRKKADWVRASLALFFDHSEKDQEAQIIGAYEKIDPSDLCPFTTTLWESQLENLNRLSTRIRRTKADIIRAAMVALLAREAEVQEREIKKHSRR
jgi:hypothetical protein